MVCVGGYGDYILIRIFFKFVTFSWERSWADWLLFQICMTLIDDYLFSLKVEQV